MNNIRKLHKESVWKEHFLGLAIVLAFLLPHTSTLFLLVNPLLCLLLVQFSKSRRWSSNVFIPLVPIMIAILSNLALVQLKAIQSTATIMLYFACFPFVGNIRVRNGYLYFILGFILLSQVVYMLGIPYIGSIIDQLYPISEGNMAAEMHERDNVTMVTMFDYRLGGLYHNSNQCSKYLTMLLAFFLINNSEERMSKITPFMFVAYLGVLMTGSRTGFVIATLIVYFGFFRKQRLSRNYKLFFGTLAFAGFIYFIQNAAGTVRGLDVESGMSNSAGIKWETFLFYLANENSAIGLLFGHLDVQLFQAQYGVAMNSFDSEYGSLAFRFGLVGLIAVFVFWYMVYKRMNSYNRIFLFNLLWVVSSTIVCSYRASFVFMLLLSVIYANYRKKPMRT